MCSASEKRSWRFEPRPCINTMSSASSRTSAGTRASNCSIDEPRLVGGDLHEQAIPRGEVNARVISAIENFRYFQVERAQVILPGQLLFSVAGAERDVMRLTHTAARHVVGSRPAEHGERAVRTDAASIIAAPEPVR